MAKSGYEAAKLLHRLGAEVTVNDGNDLSNDAHAKDLEDLGISVVSGAHPLALLDEAPIIFKTQVFHIQYLLFKKHKKQGLKILTEVELSYLISEAPIIGITGTNGKTTVTSLIGDMFNKSRENGRLSGKYWFRCIKSRTRSEDR